MSEPHFAQAAFHELSQANDTYINSRYAPIGNQELGMPFPLYKQPAAYFTDYTPAGQSDANYKRRANLPTNNTLFRNTFQGAGVALASHQNDAMVYRTQTLANNGDPIACRNNSDCASWPGTTCNPQYSSWPDSKGSQGNYCSVTQYPELSNGEYTRVNVDHGGIGRACNTDNDCNTNAGYFCNNETDMFGKNIQQTGYCSQVYHCPDSGTGNTKHYLGYPYNSGIPIVPPSNQNNKGQGYMSKDECQHNALSQQNCVQDSTGKWFATYPAYCPIPTNLRSGNSPSGQLVRTGAQQLADGIKMQGYATSQSSYLKPAHELESWNINSSVANLKDMSDPLAYELAINPSNPR